ncbi:MAG: hypothetical protein K8R21_14320 [Leptospira sp.]|nr:hypothetical protein [Leptospira sp.]
MLRNFLTKFIAVNIFLCVGVIYAETIILRNGTAVRGSITSQNEKEIAVKTAGGQILTFGKYQILKIVTKELEIPDLRKIKTEEEAILLEQEKKSSEDQISESSGSDRPGGRKNLTRWGVTWRSAVLPGWGQFHEDRNLAAILFPAIILISGFATYQKNIEYRRSISDSDKLNNPYGPASVRFTANPVALYFYNIPFEQQRHAVDHNYREVRAFGALTVFLYILNIADAAFFYKPLNVANSGLILDFAPRSSFNAVYGNTSEFKLGYYFRF